MTGKPQTPELERLLEEVDPQLRATALALRDLVHELAPDARDMVDTADHLIGFGFQDPAGGNRILWDVLAIVVHRAHVNLQFGNGVDLPDPGHFLAGNGKRARHVACRTPEEGARPAIQELIQAQLRVRGLLPEDPSDL